MTSSRKQTAVRLAEEEARGLARQINAYVEQQASLGRTVTSAVACAKLKLRASTDDMNADGIRVEALKARGEVMREAHDLAGKALALQDEELWSTGRFINVARIIGGM